MPRGSSLRGNNWAATDQEQQPTHPPVHTPTDAPVDTSTDTSINTLVDAHDQHDQHEPVEQRSQQHPGQHDLEETMAATTAERTERDTGRRAGEAIRTDPAAPVSPANRPGRQHGHGLLDVTRFTELLLNRWRPMRGASVNVALDAYLSAQLDTYCHQHNVPKRVVVSWLVAELVGKEER